MWFESAVAAGGQLHQSRYPDPPERSSTLLRDHGTWRLADVMRFAIDYAEAGYPVVTRIADAVAMAEGLFRPRGTSCDGRCAVLSMPRDTKGRRFPAFGSVSGPLM